MATTKIDTYTVNYASNKYHPRIWLYSGGKGIGQLVFIPNGTTLPDDNMTKGEVNLFYFQEEYSNALDLLRNEDPVYLFFNGTGLENGLRTLKESVGEAE